MDELKQAKQQMLLLSLAGLVLTVWSALHKNTVLALIVFVVQGTMGSVLNAKFRNGVYREISESDPAAYSDLMAVGDVSPKAAEKRGVIYSAEVAAQLTQCGRFQKLTSWMPIIEVALFFVMQFILFGKY